MKKLVLATLLLTAILSGAGRGTAQTTTATPTPAATTTGPTNSSQGTLFVCADSAILEFSGTSLIGYDIFYQIFSGASGSGTAVTGVRQVAVAGIYTASDRVTYNSGVTVAAGGSASAKVDIAREGDPSTIDFSYVLSDTQDGCNASTTTPASTEVASDTSSASAPANMGTASSIFAPNGGLLNPNLQPEPAVVVGARLSDPFRSETPGLIFASCDAYPLAEPGIIYDSDTITIFWSWYTKTLKQMDQELANAIYTVKLNTAALPMTTRSEPVLRSGNYWVFYTATVGNLRPGHYEVGFLHTWANPVNDGYQDFGPGTANTRETGICNFDVKPNPNSTRVVYSGMYFPSTYPTHPLPTAVP